MIEFPKALDLIHLSIPYFTFSPTFTSFLSFPRSYCEHLYRHSKINAERDQFRLKVKVVARTSQIIPT